MYVGMLTANLRYPQHKNSFRNTRHTRQRKNTGRLYPQTYEKRVAQPRRGAGVRAPGSPLATCGFPPFVLCRSPVGFRAAEQYPIGVIALSCSQRIQR